MARSCNSFVRHWLLYAVSLLLHVSFANSMTTPGSHLRDKLLHSRLSAHAAAPAENLDRAGQLLDARARTQSISRRASSEEGYSPSGANRTMADLVLPYNYPLEEYSVRTEDGYLLGLYRIPHGRNSETGDSTSRGGLRHGARPAVLLQHGLLQCSAVWLDTGPGRALAFILADAGFDVWLSNSRGSTWGRRHESLLPEDARFWDFSWDEMAAYDLPAIIDHVLAATGRPQLAYVGHSQGTTIALAAFSSVAGLQSKVSLAVMLAPVAFAHHVSSAVVLALAELQTDQLFDLLGATELLPTWPASSQAFGRLCSAAPEACIGFLESLCGSDDGNIDRAALPDYFVNTPAGTSVRTLVHWAQAVRSPLPAFRKYDHGVWCLDWLMRPQACNQMKYGRLAPPPYDLSAVTVPLALFSGSRDMMSTVADMALLDAALPRNTVIYRQVELTYEHLDFTWGLTAHLRIYPQIVRMLAA